MRRRQDRLKLILISRLIKKKWKKETKEDRKRRNIGIVNRINNVRRLASIITLETWHPNCVTPLHPLPPFPTSRSVPGIIIIPAISRFIWLRVRFHCRALLALPQTNDSDCDVNYEKQREEERKRKPNVAKIPFSVVARVPYRLPRQIK